MTEKSVFREAWSLELTSIISRVPFLVSQFCIPAEGKFDALMVHLYIKTRGRKIAIENKIFLCYTYMYIYQYTEEI